MKKVILMIVLLPLFCQAQQPTPSEDVLDIYPNPASEYLNVVQQQFDGRISQLEIIDLSGHTVYQINEKFTRLSIYVGTWKKGIYMVFFRQGDKEIMEKVVIH